jgi:hypothetical protein
LGGAAALAYAGFCANEIGNPSSGQIALFRVSRVFTQLSLAKVYYTMTN